MNRSQTRRQFVKKLSGAAATTIIAPAIIPASAFGRSTTAPSDRITLGHIGVGGRGSDLLRSFLQVDNQQSRLRPPVRQIRKRVHYLLRFERHCLGPNPESHGLQCRHHSEPSGPGIQGFQGTRRGVTAGENLPRTVLPGTSDGRGLHGQQRAFLQTLLKVS